MKSSIEDIRKHFDNDVERFSNEDTGQTTTMDSALVLQMVADSVAMMNPQAKSMCDIGCGAGNFTLRILRHLPHLSCTLVDLSLPMLRRAQARIQAKGGTIERVVQSDLKTAELKPGGYDVIVAAAVLHHLRSREEWSLVLRKIYDALSSGGTFWYWDLIKHEHAELENLQRERYKQYLIGLKDEAFQKGVFDSIEREDTPESVAFILRELLNTGFRSVDVIHKNAMFAAMVGKK